MNKKWIKPVVMVMVFIAAVIVTNLTMNRGNKDLTTTMAEATLPVVEFAYNGTTVEELHGYVDEMKVTEMRDSIIPINDSRTLSMSISTYGASIDEISYEIRSLDASRLVAEDEISEYQHTDNNISAEVTVPNVLENNEEYLLIFDLKTGDKSVKYYSRIMQTTEYNVDECIDFALEFHNKTLDGDGKSFIPTYMDATTGDRTTLDYVDLTSTLNQLTWGDFTGEQVAEPVVSFKEINDSYNVLTLNYIMSNVTDSGEKAYYNVEEYFRLRQTASRMYVLNYERRTNQLISADNIPIDDESNINLGIRNSDIEYKTDEAEKSIAFVQEGDLWSYDISNNDIIRIFSFRSLENIDDRENWNQHDIKIINVDEAGSVDFIVYGYMNRGNHEGQVGTAVYHYDGIAHTVEEEVFIPSDSSYEVLKAEMGKLMYINDSNELFIMLEGKVYSISLDSLKEKVIISDIEEGSYAVSASNRYFAWVDADQVSSSSSLNVLDLKTGEKKEFSKGDGTYVKPLAFIDEDLIYGVASQSDIMTDASGRTVFPMNSLVIVDTGSYEEVKNYSPASGYISDISVDNYTININLMSWTDGYYSLSGNDTIMNRAADTEHKIFVSTKTDDIMKTIRTINTSATVDRDKTNLITASMVKLESDRNVLLESEEQERFYVYVKGQVLLATDSMSEAIKSANKNMGVVVDSNQSYVWMRARDNSVSPFSQVVCNQSDASGSSVVKSISAMLNYNGIGINVGEQIAAGKTAADVLQASLTDAVILDFSGCTTEDIIFYVSQGSPVFAMTGSESAVVVIGYSSSERVYYYNPDTGSVDSASFEDADAMFAGGGYHYITYLK